MKRIVLLVAALFAATMPVASAAGPVDITFLHAMPGPLGQALKQIVDGFNATQQEVRVRAEFAGNYDQLLQKTMAQLAAGQRPDLAQLEVSLVPRLAAGGHLLPLNPLLNMGNWQDFWPVFRRQATLASIGGTVWSIPFNNSDPVLYYNRSMFDEARIVTPPATWDALLEAARGLTQPGRVTGLGLILSDIWILEGTIWSAGGEVLSDDGQHLLLDSPEALRAVDYWARAVREGTARVYPDIQSWQADFAAGRVAMGFGSIVSWRFLQPQIRFPLSVARMPYVSRPAVPVGGANLAIFKDIAPDQRQATWQFVEWLTEPAQQARWAGLTGYLPVRRSATTNPQYAPLLNLHATPSLKVGIDQLPFARPRPTAPGYVQVQVEMRNMLEQILLQSADPRGVVRQTVERANRILAEEATR